jgi:hypothetical protein
MKGLEIAGRFDLTEPAKLYQNRFKNTWVLTLVHTIDGMGRIGTIAPPTQTQSLFPPLTKIERLERLPTDATSRDPYPLNRSRER